MRPALLEQHLELALCTSAGCGLTQADLARLLVVSTKTRETVLKHFFSKERPIRPWVDDQGVVWPFGRKIVHLVLAPLVVSGVMTADTAMLTRSQEVEMADCLRRHGPEFAEYHCRALALSLVATLDDSSREYIKSMLAMRALVPLRKICSSGAIWSCALGLAKPTHILNPNSLSNPTAFSNLLGLHEPSSAAPVDTTGATSESQGEEAPSKDRLSSTSSQEFSPMAGFLRGDGHGYMHQGVSCTRSRGEQWQICYWLWREARRRRNHNVRILLKQCKKKAASASKNSSRPSGLTMEASYVTMLVESPLLRVAVADGTVHISDLLSLGAQRGQGHVQEVLKPEGIACLRAGIFSLDDLAELPRSRLVRVACKLSPKVPISAITKMTAPVAERVQMVELVLLHEPLWSPYVKADELLRLKDLSTLEFALSTHGLSGLKRKLIDLNTLDTFGQTSAQASTLLRICLNSSAGEKLLADRVITVPKLLAHVTTSSVLSVLLGDLGSERLRDGTLRLEDIDSSTSPTQLLRKLQGKPDTKKPVLAESESCAGTASSPKPRSKASGSIATWSSSGKGRPTCGTDAASDEAPEDVLEPRVDLLGRFCAQVSESVTEDEARFYLMRNGWALSAAVRDYHAAVKERSAGVDCLYEAAGGCLARDQARAFLFQYDWDLNAALDNLDQEIKVRSAAVSHWDASAAQELHERAPKRKLADLLRESRAVRQARGLGDFSQDLSSRSSVSLQASPLMPAAQSRLQTGAQEEITSSSNNSKKTQFDQDNMEARFDNGQCLLDCGKEDRSAPFPKEGADAKNDAQRTAAPAATLNAAPDDFESVLNGGGPTRKQLDTLLRFMDVSGAQTEDYSVSVLRMCDWNLELAVQTHLASLASG